MADAGTLWLHFEPVNVPLLVLQVRAVHDNRPLLDYGPLTVIGDPIRLRQILDNLVSNALRHTDPAGTVTVRAYPDGSDVVLEVVDTGSGIADADLPYVFDRFWRADKSRNRQTGGSGLGLAIVRQGSTFRVRVPSRGPGDLLAGSAHQSVSVQGVDKPKLRRGVGSEKEPDDAENPARRADGVLLEPGVDLLESGGDALRDRESKRE